MLENRLAIPAVSEWARADCLRLADHLVDSARRHASPGHARITPPGPPGPGGTAVDGLEGFARTFLLAGFRLAGSRPAGSRPPGSRPPGSRPPGSRPAGVRPAGTEKDAGNGEYERDLADWFAAGIAEGTDPASPERWVRLDEHPQAKVEAASLALILDMTRPWIWDRLGPDVRRRVVDYLSPAVGDETYPQINWVWFRLVVQTFLRSVGGPFSAAEMAADLATHDTFRRADGWLSDGPGRAYDHYTGWALHLYPILWARMAGADDLAAGRRDRDAAALDRYLRDAVTLIGADGSPLLQGRSLVYRFAAAAPFWAGAMAGVPTPPGLLRPAATRIVRHFAERGAPGGDGLLTLGWHGSWPRLAQSYSGPGSPYWAAKGLLGIALPADHPVWTAPAEPLPADTRDTLRAVRAPGWLVSGTRADGIVRVVNHGNDHAHEGSTLGDSPLYARLGYSTATAPVLDERGWVAPVDQSVVLIDRAGRCTHRTGMRSLGARIDDTGPAEVGVAGSTATVRWMTGTGGDGAPDHGGGRAGLSETAGRITVFSLVRGPWEVRLARLDELADGVEPASVRLRVGGWPVAGDGLTTVRDGWVTATGDGRTSRLGHLGAGDAADPTGAAPVDSGVETHDDASPLGRPVRVPWLDYAARPGTWVATLVELSGVDAASGRVVLHDVTGDVTIQWPDGIRTRTRREPPEKEMQ